MFTGLIQSMGRVVSCDTRDGTLRLVVAADASLLHNPGPTAGESISVDGCCLSLVGWEQARDGRPGRLALAFDVTAQTLANTTLGEISAGDHVHLERACTPTTLLGGHLVQGHVDGLATVQRVQTQPDWRLSIAPPAELMPYITPRGSVCLAGVSLTIAELDVPAGRFEVALIPETLQRTRLGRLAEGQRVNIECDCLVKAVVHWQRHYAAQDAPGPPKPAQTETVRHTPGPPSTGLQPAESPKP